MRRDKMMEMMTALEALADHYRALPPDVAKNWLDESRMPATLSEELRDPFTESVFIIGKSGSSERAYPADQK